MKHSLIKKLKKNGGLIIKPNPVTSNLLKFNIPKAMNRYHQKVKLIDNDIFIGSINCNNDYGGIKFGTFDFIDLSLYLKNSPCVNKVVNFFRNIIINNIHFFNSKKKKETLKNYIPEEKIINNNLYEEFLEESPPNKTEISNKIEEILNNAKEKITIIQSYYLNIRKIEEILIKALKRGVKVEIITAKRRTQISYKFFLNEILFEELLKNGATIYEFLDKQLHMKSYCIDNKILTLGSFNNDITSFRCNNEANYLLKKNNFNKNVFIEYEKLIAQLKKNCSKVLYKERKNFSKLRLLTFNFFNFGLYLMGTFFASKTV